MKKAKELGYQIHLRYVGVNTPEIARERIAIRISKGGHGVSANTVDRRFKAAKENLVKLIPYCDSVNVYDNSGETMRIVAYLLHGNLELIAECFWLQELIKK